MMKSNQKFIDKINKKIVDNTDRKRVLDVLRTGFLSKPEGGPVVVEFQNIMASAHKKKYAFGVTSGTAALHCAMIALKLKKGDEVIIPAIANIADCSVVIQEGGKPEFVDVDQNDFNIDPNKIEAKITSKTRAIIAVHMYGQPVKIDEIKKIAKKHNLVFIEDCAQAAGAKYKGQYVGSYGDISCFSLYQTKHIICGEGGVIATNSDRHANSIVSFTNNGIMREDLDAYDYDRIGLNYQLSELQAALAIGQFKKLDKNNLVRRRNVQLYKKLLADLDIQFQEVNKDTENSYFYLTGLLPDRLHKKRDEFLNIVKQLHVPIKKLYPLALTELTLLKNTVAQDCPVAQRITKGLFNLYVNPGLNKKDITIMAAAVRQAYMKIMG